MTTKGNTHYHEYTSSFNDKVVKKRTCLKCGKKFNSRNSANRICIKCDKKNTKVNKG